LVAGGCRAWYVAGVSREASPRLCPGCKQSRPKASFMVHPRGDPERKALMAHVCELCRRGGKSIVHKLVEPPSTAKEMQEAMKASALPASEVLTEVRDFALLKAIEGGATLAQAEVASGYRIGGASRKKLLGTEEFRLGMQLFLIQRGVDRDKIAKTIVECLEATRGRFNPLTLEFDPEPDYSVRLRAADTAARLLDVMPRTHQATGGVAVVIIKTNLKDHPKEKEVQGAYVVESRKPQPDPERAAP